MAKKIKGTKIYSYRSKHFDALKWHLNHLSKQVDLPEYISKDPVSFMHAYVEKKDQEIAGFFAAIMAWGRRDIVVNKLEDLMSRMDNQPWYFIRDYTGQNAAAFQGFKHRTFKASDLHWLSLALHRIYAGHPDFEHFWEHCYTKAEYDAEKLMEQFHRAFFDCIPEAEERVKKHVSNQAKNSSCKRLWLYLKWCLRQQSHVDLGIWTFLPAEKLYIPLDVHVGRWARALGLLTRKQDDWKSVQELTRCLRRFDSEDPAKFDFALFGLGALGHEIPQELIRNPRCLHQNFTKA